MQIVKSSLRNGPVKVRISAVHSATELPTFRVGSGWSWVLRITTTQSLEMFGTFLEFWLSMVKHFGVG